MAAATPAPLEFPAGWVETDGGVEQSFTFLTFAAAWTFMCRIAAVAQAMDHHPDWSNSYTKVSIRLTTHSAGGLSPLDAELACKISEIWDSK